MGLLYLAPSSVKFYLSKLCRALNSNTAPQSYRQRHLSWALPSHMKLPALPAYIRRRYSPESKPPQKFQAGWPVNPSETPFLWSISVANQLHVPSDETSVVQLLKGVPESSSASCNPRITRTNFRSNN